MRKMFFLLLAVVCLTAFMGTAVYARDDIKVGTYVINMGEFSVATGNFTVDFYLTLKSDKTPEFPMDTFEIMNNKATSMEKIQDFPNLKQYRIRANLNSPIDLKSFPFDTQKLQIKIENKIYTSDKVVYVPMKEESSLDKLVNFNGWKISNWEVVEEKHVYSVFKEEYSAYSFNVNVGKIIPNAFFKTFIPVLITMLIIVASYSIPMDKVKLRFELSVQALIATVLFHINISNQIPPVSYLTIADKFMIMSYLFLLSTFVLNVFLMNIIENGKFELANIVYKKLEFSMAAIIPLIYACFFSYVLKF